MSDEFKGSPLPLPYYESDLLTLTKRDWFAGMALQTIDVQAHVEAPAAEIIARSAYHIADAMIRERLK